MTNIENTAFTQGDAIVRAARRYLGVRFRHQGRKTGADIPPAGLDCLGLLLAVSADLGLTDAAGAPLAQLDECDYGHTPDGSRLRTALEQYLHGIDPANIRPGDIVLLAPDGAPRHLAIVTQGDFCTQNTAFGMIHAYAQARKVAEHALDAWWKQRITAAYRVPSYLPASSAVMNLSYYPD